MTKKYTIIWPIALLCVAFLMSACAPLLIGTAAGLVAVHHEHGWCWRHYGNPNCQMPMGVHR